MMTCSCISLLYGDRWQFLRHLERNGQNAVAVTMQKIARAYLQASHGDRISDRNDVRVAMGNGNVAGEDREAEPAQGGQVARRAVGDDARTTKRPVNVGMDFTEDRSRGSTAGLIFDYEHARLGDSEELFPPVSPDRHRRAHLRAVQRSSHAAAGHNRPAGVAPETGNGSWNPCSLRCATGPPVASIEFATTQVSSLRSNSSVCASNGAIGNASRSRCVIANCFRRPAWALQTGRVGSDPVRPVRPAPLASARKRPRSVRLSPSR